MKKYEPLLFFSRCKWELQDSANKSILLISSWKDDRSISLTITRAHHTCPNGKKGLTDNWISKLSRCSYQHSLQLRTLPAFPVKSFPFYLSLKIKCITEYIILILSTKFPRNVPGFLQHHFMFNHAHHPSKTTFLSAYRSSTMCT